jgi:hypothetical protein
MASIRCITVALMCWCVTGLAHEARVDQVPPSFDPGVFAVTSTGPVELSVYGERAFVAGDMNPRVFYPPGAFDRIAPVDDIKAFVVNMTGWTPRDLYMLVGRKRLAAPYQKNQRLVGRMSSSGPTLIKVESEGFDLASLQRDYLRLLPKKATTEESEAFIVLEVKSRDGLNDRSYPVRIRLPAQGR